MAKELNLLIDQQEIEMPNAQVSDVPKQFDLKTCPDGYVKLRRLSYGEKLSRNENVSKSTVRGEGRTTQMTIELLQQETNFLDFAACVVEHNLTYLDPQTEEELPFDFKGRYWQAKLDPRIGEEISSYIDELNNYDKEEGSKN